MKQPKTTNANNTNNKTVNGEMSATIAHSDRAIGKPEREKKSFQHFRPKQHKGNHGGGFGGV